LNRGWLVSTPTAIVSAFFAPIGLFRSSSSFTPSSPMIAPAAACTSGRRCTRPSSDAGTVGVPAAEFLTISRPEITALVSL
jgi:hypothetical protein